jgi:hypothetical protein
LWRIPVGVLVIAAYLAGAVRAWRVEFRADPQGVSVINQWRTYRFSWDEVRRMKVIGTRLPAVSFVLADGNVRSVQASSYSRALRTTAWAIAKTFAPSTVERDDDATVWSRR